MSRAVGYILEELIGKQRAVDEAHAQVEDLRERFGSPSADSSTPAQAAAYETAWRAWRDLARDMQDAVARYAK